MNDHGVVHFEIPANDPEKLSKFYTDLFGWQIMKMPMGDMDYYVTVTADSDENGMPKKPGSINGGIMKRQMPQQTPMNYVGVESVDQFLQKAQGLGAQVIMPKMAVPQMGWFAVLTDIDGNQFGLWQTDPTANN